jgi:hypothetical protein
MINLYKGGQVVIHPSQKEKGTGLTTLISWQNPELKKMLNELFCIKNNEEIEKVEVDNYGITIRIKT